MSFDYGDKKSDGQYERHPINNTGEYVAPIRNSYIHDKCGEKTLCGDDIAETYAKNPKFYGRTFCVQCRNYFPVSEFKWAVDRVVLGELGGKAGENLKESWKKYL